AAHAVATLDANEDARGCVLDTAGPVGARDHRGLPIEGGATVGANVLALDIVTRAGAIAGYATVLKTLSLIVPCATLRLGFALGTGVVRAALPPLPPGSHIARNQAHPTIPPTPPARAARPPAAGCGHADAGAASAARSAGRCGCLGGAVRLVLRASEHANE